MTFTKNDAHANEVRDHYGDYLLTFRSDSGQVSAELFNKDGEVVAYVSFGEGFSFENLTDNYLSPLRQKAAELGFSKFRIIYSGF
jgi:hypothetical protein